MDKKKNFALIMIIYLFGLFIGALSTGIITPARTIIQNSLGVGEQTGIWMITIYTLCYAAIIPVAGKMADRMGRKLIYIISIALFGIGSVICGLSANAGSFGILIAGRVVQAIGAGGIMPIATAEFGTSFPEEKRGMALGLVGAVYGIANVLGATAGSAILDIFGTANWQWIFYINVPFCALIIAGSLFFIPNSRSEVVGRIDKLGTLLMTLIILSLLYGLKNIDFFNFLPSLAEKDVWPFLLMAIVLLPLFVWAEKRAEDPIFNLAYVKNRQIVITLLISLFVGASMMGMIFIPQFSENALHIPTGSGGYFVIILGLCAGVASPISGTLIDKMGAKPVLAAGLAISVLGCLYLSFITINFINWFNVIACLILIGLGLGLTMGTPLNYMMLRHTGDEEANSALATLSLVRSIGTAIAPAIMVGFLAQAGMCMSANLMEAMPPIPQVAVMEQQEELDDIFAELKELNKDNPEMLEMLSAMDGMDMGSGMSMNMDMAGGDMELPDELLKGLQNADVTTIVDETKNMAAYMFDASTPAVIKSIQNGIGAGIDGIGTGIDGISRGIAAMEQSGNPAMMGAVQGMQHQKSLMERAQVLMGEMRDEIPDVFAQSKDAYMAAIDENSDSIEAVYQDTLNDGFRGMYITVAAFNAIALILIALYREERKPKTA